MTRLESIEDEVKGLVTYELKDGRRVRLDAFLVKEHGGAEMLRYMGLTDQIPTERVPVMHHGERVGTLPGDFDPLRFESLSWLYDARSDDFRRDGDVWVAVKNLGPADLNAVKGFRRD